MKNPGLFEFGPDSFLNICFSFFLTFSSFNSNFLSETCPVIYQVTGNPGPIRDFFHNLYPNSLCMAHGSRVTKKVSVSLK